MRKKFDVEEWHNRHLDGAEILFRDVRIKISHTNRTEKASVIGKSKMYGLFALVKDNVRYVHRTNGNDVLQYTWY